jgi:hypothetical protein
MSFRTPEMEEEYRIAKEQKTLKKLYEEAPVREYEHWLLVVNKFWHNKKDTFGLLIVTRRAGGNIWQTTRAEQHELFDTIGPWIDDKFDTLMFNLKSMRSIEDVAHGHVSILKDEFK